MNADRRSGNWRPEAPLSFSVPRPSRLYKNGIGKPVVAKRWDEVIRAYRWRVVFLPCNNFGCYPVAPEAKLVGQAEAWCDHMNRKLRLAAQQGV